MYHLRLFAVGLVGLVLVIAVMAWTGILDTIGILSMGVNPEVYKTFAGMCRVENQKELPEKLSGTPQAAEFTGGWALHPIIVLTTAGELYESANSVPPGWNPKALGDTQLVLCVTKGRLDLPAPPFPICYHNVDYAPGRRVGLYAARTGKKLWSGDFYRYYEPCAGSNVDETALSNILTQIQAKITDGSIKP